MIANRRLTQSLVGIGLVLSGISAAWLAYGMEHTQAEPNKVLILLVALVTPCTIALLYITEVATTWLLDHWLEADREAIYVETYDKPLQAAMRRLEIVNQLPNGSLTEKIYCTSHCNLFANAGGRNEKEKVFLEDINRDFFARLATLAMTSRDSGLQLLLQYADSDGSLEKELPIRIDIFLEVAETLKMELYPAHFGARRLLQESVKDYFVVEDHVFKTIRKTPEAGGQTEFMHIKSAKIAAAYRTWLEDLFFNGAGEKNPVPYVEEKQIRRRFDEMRTEVELSRKARGLPRG